MNLIKKNKVSGKYNATTLSGKHLLWVCVDDEIMSSELPDLKFIYNKAAKLV